MFRKSPRPAFQPCSIELWRSQREERVLETALALRRIYALMVSFEEASADFSALMCPSSVVKMNEKRNGLVQVSLHLLDRDLQPAMKVKGVISDGYILTRKTIANRPKSAYLRPYTEGILDDDFPELSYSLDIPKPIIEPVEEYATL
jgi:hypothetical protein